MLNSIQKWLKQLLQINRDIYYEKERPQMNRSKRRQKERDEARKSRRFY